MSNKPTHASVTSVPCTCSYLERAADEPENPIVFHESTGEYQFTYPDSVDGGTAMLVIYHCPFCGGAAPDSKRPAMFHVVSRTETDRLLTILRACKNVEDVLAALGPPDRDDPTGCSSTTFEEVDCPPQITIERLLVYENLSDVADVHVTERPNGKIGFSISGKPKSASYGIRIKDC
ncbi:DUF6980 family protein [Aeoliella sp.]|uniref:DUF6980 family protein n=1 Tax=Aeoliella sp. TaxID=2795800 RepID=UPI003CCB937A